MLMAAEQSNSFSFAEIALLGFFALFLGIVIWTLLRPRKQIDRWSRIPLDDQEVQEPRNEKKD